MKFRIKSRASISALVFVITAVTIACALRFGSAQDLSLDWIIQMRLPRVLMALGCGVALALSGLILQTICHNPLCEPYSLGISSGATLGVVIASSLSFLPTTVGAILGSVFSVVLLWMMTRGLRSSPLHLILSGMMLGILGASFVAIWLNIQEPGQASSILSWLFGDLSRSTLRSAVLLLGVSIFFSIWAWMRRHHFDAYLLGEMGVRNLALDPIKIQRQWILIASILVSLTVSAAGMIGFVGLVVPNLLRALGINLHVRLIPLSVFLGGIVLVWGDLISRVLIAPVEIPIGVITGVFGAPVFLWVLRKERA